MKIIILKAGSISLVLLICISFTFLSSCKKQDQFLDAKRSNHDVTPQTLQDFQAVLDNNQVMNGYGSVLGLVGSDNIYTPDANLDAADQTSRNAYLWAKDIFQGATSSDWTYCYQTVEYANIVLDGLKKLDATDQTVEYNNIKGSALFYRAFSFYQLAQLFCKVYTPNTSASDLGIPLRLSSDVNLKYPRSTVQQSYDQIISDLKIAVLLLPKTPMYKTRPSSVAANALLSKVYFSMSDYSNAAQYANLTLKDYSTLLDYSTLTINTSNPFPTLAKGHPEVIYHAWGYGNGMVYATSIAKARVSPQLYQSYEPGDLRPKLFFTADGVTGYYKFKGPYSANPYDFCGIATDEIYLIRAECSARAGDLTSALNDLNDLLKKRYTPVSFLPLIITDKQTLLTRIILERRKEMPFTGNIRWEDLRRLNLDNNFQLQLNRVYHGISYILPANDPKYVLPLPDEEIQIDKLIQNNR